MICSAVAQNYLADSSMTEGHLVIIVLDDFCFDRRKTLLEADNRLRIVEVK
jgi:hypothetical protein